MGFVMLSELVHGTKIHRVYRETRDGRTVWVKHRRAGMPGVIAAGAVFLAISNSGIRMFPSTTRWQRWELACFGRLYPNRACGTEGRTGVWQEEIPGLSLRSHLQAKSLTAEMLAATGRMLREVHAGGFTHGDPHMGYVLVDDSGRARLIDFETQHDLRRPLPWRRADDLFVLLLELVARHPVWKPLAGALLQGYGARSVLAVLHARLRPPRGWEKVLWLSRSPGSTGPKLIDDLFQLRCVTMAT